MANYRDQSAKDAKQNYERMMVQAFVEAHRVLKPGALLVCVHPYLSTWDLPTLKDTLQHAGFVIIETWLLNTETPRLPVADDKETLPSSIILVARRSESQATNASASEACSE